MKIVRFVVPFVLAASVAFAADGGRSARITVDPSLPACGKVSAGEMARHVGVPARIRESNAGAKGMGNCIWVGSREGVTVKVTYLPGESFGVPAGQERAYFDQIMAGRKAQNRPGEFTLVPGLGDVAWSLNLVDNAPRYYAVDLFKGGHMLSVATNGLDLATTIAIAREAAGRM